MNVPLRQAWMKPEIALDLPVVQRHSTMHGCGRLQAFETSTMVSVQDVVLNTQKTVHATKSTTPRAQPLLPHTQTRKAKCLAHVAMVLVDVSLLDTKQMLRSRQLTSFCHLHKSDQKHMSSQKVFTSRHGLFAQISLNV